MKLSISNISWIKENDNLVYNKMQEYGFTGLEIAPTRWFEENPYEKLNEATIYAEKLKTDFGLNISSMQSIWYGKQERIVGSKADRKILLNYTKQAIIFAESIGCKNIVFGCPKNRNMDNISQENIILDFLDDIATTAKKHGVIIALEPNPVIYGTNFVNTTFEAINKINFINNSALKLNLDFGAIIENNEKLNILNNNINLINHVHISEPMLKTIKERLEHIELFELLKNKYNNYISLEMGLTSLDSVKSSMEYLVKVFK